MSILTEKEATDKYCPQTMTATPLRRDPAYEFYPSYCIASECIAWRWFYERQDFPGMRMTIGTRTEKGYCGLAGKPDG